MCFEGWLSIETWSNCWFFEIARTNVTKKLNSPFFNIILCIMRRTRSGHFQFLRLPITVFNGKQCQIIVGSGKNWKCPGLGDISYLCCTITFVRSRSGNLTVAYTYVTFMLNNCSGSNISTCDMYYVTLKIRRKTINFA